ncbi:hypothetical protein [Novosphingobium sp. ST904]|uniref:hypothetical protein n=1 Tax=Novosphingobium sp. ST904 TaxID=1684385 RepID=UPI000ADBA69B|nr:hypothetical protein [Novosphingobium sp. ST904]TCM24923.1 hypothetical protein EDF59_14810 [Novosphingobium sp. ST904]
MMGPENLNSAPYTGGRRATFTRHGAVRSQQRSVPHAVVDALIDFGEAEHDGRGAVRHFFSRRAWKTYSAYLGTEARHYERYRAAYVVLGEDGAVVTTGWRH